MNGKVFIDSNVLVYALAKDVPEKLIIARQLIRSPFKISPQVVFECLNVALKN